MAAINFLQTSTSPDELRAALQVMREFKTHETTEEWMARPFATWIMFEMLEEYLDHLVNGTPLKEDTIEALRRQS